MSIAEQAVFPCGSGDLRDGAGMTLLQHYAGLAMQGLCVHVSANYSAGPCDEAIVNRAFFLAELMIARLEKAAP